MRNCNANGQHSSQTTACEHLTLAPCLTLQKMQRYGLGGKMAVRRKTFPPAEGSYHVGNSYLEATRAKKAMNFWVVRDTLLFIKQMVRKQLRHALEVWIVAKQNRRADVGRFMPAGALFNLMVPLGLFMLLVSNASDTCVTMLPHKSESNVIVFEFNRVSALVDRPFR
jgi:hypothetical protein